MSGGRRRRPLRARSRPPARRPRRAGGPALIALLLALAAAWWALHPRPARAPRETSAESPAAAYGRALALLKEQRIAESLPEFRSALSGTERPTWEMHVNYAAALYNLTIQYGERAGHPVRRTRDSPERVRLMREALIEFGRAAALAPDGHARAQVLAMRGQALFVWGLVWEAFVSYREASLADPRDAGIRGHALGLQRLLQDPLAASEPDPSPQRAGAAAP